MKVIHLSTWRDARSLTEGEQLEGWALEILSRDPKGWVIPDTFSMRSALDGLWTKRRAEKRWIEGKNAYRLEPTPPPPGAAPKQGDTP